jgi:CHAT domain-containing protein/tetratricopeptide (TPR) repeat protein
MRNWLLGGAIGVLCCGVMVVAELPASGGVVAQTVDARKVEADRLLQQGRQQYQVSQFEAAYQSWQQALKLYREIKDRRGQANALINLGNAYLSLSQYEKAIEILQERLALNREEKNRAGELDSLFFGGWAYNFQGHYQQAIEFFRQTLAIARETGDRGKEVSSLYALGWAYDDLGQRQKSVELHQEAFEIAQKSNNLAGMANTLNGLGWVHNSLGKHQQAINFFQQQLSLAKQINDPRQKANSFNGLGWSFRALKHYSKAIFFSQQALTIQQQIGDSREEAYSLGDLGKTFAALDESQKAIEFYQRALAIQSKIGNRWGEGVTLHDMANSLLQQNQPELAIAFYKQSVNVRESIRRDIQGLPHEQQKSFAQTVAGTYRALADLLIEQGRIGEAQQVLELLKIQEINDITKGTRSPSTLTQVALTQVEQEIIKTHSSLINFGQQRDTCKQTNCPRLEEYNQTYRTLTETYEKFIEDIKTQLTQERDKSIAASTDDFTGGASKIVNTQPNTVLIYPLVLKDKTRILWASKGGILSQAECPLGEAQLSKLTAQFRTALQTSDDLNPVQKAGKDLYQCLLPQKLRTELTQNKIKNLVFVPDLITNYIPMAALYDGTQYLIEQFAVSNILSASLTDTQDRLPDRPSVLGFGLSNAVTLSNPTRNFGSLPYVPYELESIIKKAGTTSPGIFPGSTWLNSDFSQKNLENKLFNQKPNILHIATHGEFLPSSPKNSYLLLGDGTPYEISKIQYLEDLQNVHLVVLSACETALGGSDRNGLEVAGIASYFLSSNAKAKAVLASLWKVNDPATSLLMSKFYGSLSIDHLSKAQALQKVQREMIISKLTLQDAANRAGARLYEPNKKRPQNLSHPYYWAPFILIGNSL